MAIYNNELSYEQYPIVKREWGYEIPIMFRNLSGEQFNFVMNFQKDPSKEEISKMIDFWAVKATPVFVEEIIAEDGIII